MGSRSEWNPDVFNGASFVGGIVAILVMTACLYVVWRVGVAPMIERVRAERRWRGELRTRRLRAQIKAEVLEAMGVSEDAELDPEDFEGDVQDDPAWPGSGQPD